jgi:hypothetical protein
MPDYKRATGLMIANLVCSFAALRRVRLDFRACSYNIQQAGLHFPGVARTLVNPELEFVNNGAVGLYNVRFVDRLSLPFFPMH